MHSYSDDEVVEKAKQCFVLPPEYSTSDDTEVWAITGPGMSRDSKAREIAIFQAAYKEFRDAFPDDFEIQHSSHWAVGWVDTVRCRILKEPGEVTLDNITDAFHKFLELAEAGEEQYETAIMEAEYEAQLQCIKNYIGNGKTRVPDDVEEDHAASNVFGWLWDSGIYPHDNSFRDEDIELACFHLGYVERGEFYEDDWMEWLEDKPKEVEVFKQAVEWLNNINQVAIEFGG